MTETFVIKDIYNLPLYAAPVSCDKVENAVIYVKTIVSEEENTYLSSLILVDTVTKAEQILVPATSMNFYPQWSESGEQVLFLSNQTGTVQAYVYDFKTQETTQQTYTTNGVSHILWQREMQGFFFTTVAKENQTELTWQPAAKPEKSAIADVYITEKIHYKGNGRGFIPDDDQEVICYQAVGAAGCEILSDYNQGYGLKRPMAISPDGQYLAVERELAKGDQFNFDSGVFVLELATKKWQHITEQHSTGAFGEPCFSPDGRYIAMIGNPLSYLTSNEFRVFLYDRETAEMVNLLPDEDVQVSDFCVSDFKLNTTNSQIQWSPDGSRVFFVVSVEGRVAIYALSVTGKLEKVWNELVHVTDFCCGKTSNRLFATISSPEISSALFELDLDTQSKEQLTPAVEPTRNYAKYEAIEYQAADGGRIPGFLVHPTTKMLGQDKAPLILNIHGGPYTMHGATFHHEVQTMAASGYYVLLMNPRGSFGYGQAHIDGVIKRYGKEDYTDLMTALEGVLADNSSIDKEGLYVCGGSYGGYLTNWIVTHTHRFKAAVTQRSMVNMVSMIGTSDNGYFFNVSESGADITTPQALWEESPLAYIENIETPLLILHSEEDYRCPIEQAEQLYIAIKYLRKDARFVRFPHSNHELSRSGIPSYRVLRLQELLCWFERYK